MSAKVTPATLPPWTEMNTTLRTCDEKTASEMLAKAVKAGLHPSLLQRIHARFNRLRRDRELRELMTAKPTK